MIYYISTKKNIVDNNAIRKYFGNKHELLYIKNIDDVNLFNRKDILFINKDLEKDDFINLLNIKCKTYVKTNYITSFFKSTSNIIVNNVNYTKIKTYYSINVNNKLKRVVDIIGAILLLLLLSPLFLVISILVRCTSKGKIIYIQERVGMNNKIFKIYKFRSMYENSEGKIPSLVKINDKRITKLGKFLRRFKLDEMPQFINVLKGDMSLIGPRPERKYFVDVFESCVKHYNIRFLVKPGIVSLSHIYGDYYTSAEIRILYDLQYIFNYNVINEIVLLFKTIKVVIKN